VRPILEVIFAERDTCGSHE